MHHATDPTSRVKFHRLPIRHKDLSTARQPTWRERDVESTHVHRIHKVRQHHPSPQSELLSELRPLIVRRESPAYLAHNIIGGDVQRGGEVCFEESQPLTWKELGLEVAVSKLERAAEEARMF